MAISTNGTVIARLAGGLYNTVMSNATYLEVAAQDPSTLANTLYARDFAKSTDLAVATTLVTNLGLSSVTGLDNWVAAQLTAAGSAKGAKIVSLLNDFAGMASDATYGAAATAFNTKVDAALASSQKTGSVEAKFETAGVVAVANATFTLTTGTDSGATFTGGAGDDTFNATVATLGALDSIDGGAGTNTLNITDSASIASQPATVTNIQKFNATSTAGSVGAVAVDAKIAAKQEATYDFGATGISLGGTNKKIVAVTVGGVTKTVGTASSDATVASIAAAIEQILDEANGTDIDTDGAGADTDTALWTSVSSNVVTVKALTAGVALPTISFAAGSSTVSGTTTTGDGVFSATSPAVFTKAVQANQAASAAVAASTVSVPTGVTVATISAATTANVASVSTAETTVTGTAVTLSGGASQTVTASDSVKATGATGAVVVKVSAAPATSIAAASTGGWAAGAGTYVTGGTTVQITEAVGAASSGSISATNTSAVQVGNNPESASGTKVSGYSSGARGSSTTDNFPEVIGNKSSAPTGDVTVTKLSAYTNAAGLASVKYGNGDVKIYMNGGTTASVTGASTATIQDINTTLLRASSTATAAPGTSKLTTVNLQGTSGTVTIASDALTNLSVIDSAGSTVTVNSNTGANTGALNLSIGNSGSSGTPLKVQQANATSVAVTAVASPYAAKEATKNTNYAYLDLEAAKATSLSFGGATAKIFLNSAAGDLAKLTTITANGSGALDLGTVSGFTKLTSVDASAASGKIALSVGPTIGVSGVDNHGLAIKTGSADDTVTLTGAISSGTDTSGNVVVQTVELGAGNDKVISSSGSIGTGATVNGGEGTDVIAASLLTAGNATRITNFEVLGLDLTTGTYDASLLVGATGLSALAGGGTYTGVTPAQGLTVGQNIASGTNTLTFSTTVNGTSSKADAYAITFAATAGSSATATSKDAISGSTLAINGIETVTIASGGTGFVANSLTLTGDAVRTITVTGDQDLSLTLTATMGNGVTPDALNGNGVSLIDGSAMTGKFTISNANIATPANGVSTIKGGAGNDAITAALAKTVVDGGAGNDTITVSTTVATTLTGGAGKDTFVLTSATANSTTAGSTIITTITDYNRTEDTIQFGDADPLLKFVPTSGSTFTEVLTAALNGSGTPAGAAANSAVWFTYGGDTYIAKQDATATFGTGDIIVKLTGIVDLTSAADNAAGNTTGLVGTA